MRDEWPDFKRKIMNIINFRGIKVEALMFNIAFLQWALVLVNLIKTSLALDERCCPWFPFKKKKYLSANMGFRLSCISFKYHGLKG